MSPPRVATFRAHHTHKNANHNIRCELCKRSVSSMRSRNTLKSALVRLTRSSTDCVRASPSRARFYATDAKSVIVTVGGRGQRTKIAYAEVYTRTFWNDAWVHGWTRVHVYKYIHFYVHKSISGPIDWQAYNLSVRMGQEKCVYCASWPFVTFNTRHTCSDSINGPISTNLHYHNLRNSNMCVCVCATYMVELFH